MAAKELQERLGRFTGLAPISPVVIDSWRRSDAAGVDPGRFPTFRRVAPEEFLRRQAASRLLIDLAVPHLRWLSKWFEHRRHAAYLVDEDGIVLHAEGDADVIERFRLAPGYDWSEALMGTNGAGTALASGAPVAVIGCEHWSEAWKGATCLGAPILGRDGAPVGAIDISMEVADGDADRLVVAAHVAYTVAQELARHQAEHESKLAAERYATLRSAFDSEQEARALAEAALERLRAAERALRKSETWLQTILDSTPALVYVVDSEDRFRLINRRFAELFELPIDELPRRSLRDYFTPEVAAQFSANNRLVLASGEVREFEEVVAVGNETRTYISVKAPLYDGGAAPYAVCGVATDITERKRLVSALEAAHLQKDAFITMIAHELRQPLGAIQSAVAALGLEGRNEVGARAAAIVERQVQHLSRMVEDLMDAGSIAQGKVALRRERVALADIIAAAATIVEPTVRARGQRLQLDLPHEVACVDGDPARLQQVFSNLLVNAAKFTPPGGHVRVALDVADSDVLVRVADSGAGISAEALPHIFDLFSQASSSGGGLGIGLSVVRGLVHAHGGTVAARSDGPGRGSEFTVRFPRVGRQGVGSVLPETPAR